MTLRKGLKVTQLPSLVEVQFLACLELGDIVDVMVAKVFSIQELLISVGQPNEPDQPGPN